MTTTTTPTIENVFATLTTVTGGREVSKGQTERFAKALKCYASQYEVALPKRHGIMALAITVEGEVGAFREFAITVGTLYIEKTANGFFLNYTEM